MTAREEFYSLIPQYEARGMDRLRAVAALVRERPELHAKFVAEANGRRATYAPAFSEEQSMPAPRVNFHRWR